MAERHANSATIRWENIIQSIEEGLVAVKTTNDQASEGHTFYNSMLPRITGLTQQASELSVTMAVERCDFEEREHDRERLRRQDMEDAEVAARLTRDMEAEERLRMERDTVMATTLARHPTETLQHATQSHVPAGAVTGTHQAASQSGSRFSNVNENPDSLTEALLPPDGERGQLSSSMSGGVCASTNAVASAAGSYRPPQVAHQRPALLSHTSAGIPGVYQVSNFEKPPTRVEDELVARLVAMDFDAEKALEALVRHDNNFEHALNDLLSENNG